MNEGSKNSEMQYKIGLAELQDKDELLKLYTSMIGMPGCTWNEHYPNIDIIAWDIENKNVYCLYGESGEIIAAASVCISDSLYGYEEGGLNDVDCYTNAEKWAEFARIAVSKNFQGRGFAKMLLEYIISILKNRDFISVRLLVSENNITAVALYKKLGFKRCGGVYMYEQDWLCYELILADLADGGIA